MANSPKIPVEEAFNEFVVRVGGKLVQELMPRTQPLPRNADYFFPQDCVVAELKCLEKDLFQDDKYKRKLSKLYEKWVLRGLIRPLDSQDDKISLPEECGQEMLRLARRTVEDRVRSADRQISETKLFLNVPQAKGLLLLANDGNYSFESANIMYLTGQILMARGERSSIDGFVYLTVNMPATIPESERSWMVWTPAYKAPLNEGLAQFVDKLGAQWASFYASKLGAELKGSQPIYEDVEEVMDRMRFVKPS